MRAGPLSDGISVPMGRDARELEFSLCVHAPRKGHESTQ